MITIGGRGGGPIVSNVTTNVSRTFECHPGGETHGTLLLGLASAGVLANLSLAGLIMARKSLRRWSSGLLLHGTIVDGARAALLIPLGLSVLRCQPVTRCSLVDTAFLLLATVASLNLLTASLSDAPLLPPPVLVPTLLQSAGYTRSQNNHYASPLYPKGEHASYYSDYYEEDANLLAETTAMPDSPQCVLFGTFMVWFAALTINLGPTFLSGALAAQAEVTPRAPSCPLVRGPARHAVLNALWAAVNLLCVGLAAAHLRKLKKDLTRARLGLLAAAGAGLAGLAGIASPSMGVHYTHNPAHPSNAVAGSSSCLGQQSSANNPAHATPSEVDAFLRQAQKNGRCHIRTLGTLAIINLLCWVPLYVCALVAPVGTGAWEDPAPIAYEITLIAAFAHSVAHPMFLLLLHEQLRDGLKLCMIDWCCCICLWLGMDFDPPGSSPSFRRRSHRDRDRDRERDRDRDHDHIADNHSHHSIHSSHSRPVSRSHSPHSLHHGTSEIHIPGSGSLKLKRTASIKSDRLIITANLGSGGIGPPSPPLPLTDDMLPPPPLPPANSAFRKQVSLEDNSPSLDNRW